MRFNDEQNPYAAPVADDAYDRRDDHDEMQVSAEPVTRWFARFIDGMLALACVVPVWIVLFQFDVLSWRDIQRDSTLMTLYMWLGAMPLAIYQWSLLARTGQTIGKKWLKIRVVKVNGDRVDFASGVLLREWVTGAIGVIPLVGPVVNLIGVLMIFGEERRCLHDRIAGTRVIALLRG